MPVYKVKSTIQHDGKVYNVGEELSDLNESQAKELLAASVLEAPESENETAGPTLPTPPTAEDEELERGQVDDQVSQNVNQDVADAERMANTPGQPIVNNKPSNIVDKAKQALGIDQAKEQPSADEVKKTADEFN